MIKSTKNKDVSMREKNNYLFYNDYVFNNDFIDSILRLKHKWGLPLKVGANNEDVPLAIALEEFSKICGLEGVLELKEDLEKIMRDSDMGRHWLDSLFLYLLKENGPIKHIPSLTFGISNQERNLKNKTITLEVGPHTTLRDIASFWPQIEKMQKEVWPGVKKKKISRKSIDVLFVHLSGILLSEKKFQRKRYENLIKIIRDKEDMAPEDKKEAVENLKNRILMLKKEEPRDNDIVAQLWDDDENEDISVKADKKRANRLRQIRKRKK